MNDETRKEILEALSECENAIMQLNSKLTHMKNLMGMTTTRPPHYPDAEGIRGTIEEMRKRLMEQAEAERESILKQAQEAVGGSRGHMAWKPSAIPAMPLPRRK